MNTPRKYYVNNPDVTDVGGVPVQQEGDHKVVVMPEDLAQEHLNSGLLAQEGPEDEADDDDDALTFEGGAGGDTTPGTA